MHTLNFLMENPVFWGLPILALSLYFLPTLRAIKNRSGNYVWIFLLNLVAGLTIYAWLYALIVMAAPKPRYDA